jgi:hypothetical protein
MDPFDDFFWIDSEQKMVREVLFIAKATLLMFRRVAIFIARLRS